MLWSYICFVLMASVGVVAVMRAVRYIYSWFQWRRILRKAIMPARGREWDFDERGELVYRERKER
jgi:hypothetical protein